MGLGWGGDGVQRGRRLGVYQVEMTVGMEKIWGRVGADKGKSHRKFRETQLKAGEWGRVVGG